LHVALHHAGKHYAMCAHSNPFSLTVTFQIWRTN